MEKLDKVNPDQKQLDEGLKIFDYSRRVSKVLGLWPLESNDYIFTLTYCYFTVIMILEWTDFYYSLGDLDQVLDNLAENLSYTHIYIRGIILRVHINKLKIIIQDTISDFTLNSFQSSYEIKLFMTYIEKGRFFIKSIIYFIISIVVIWYFLPLLATPDPNANLNETAIYLLPYRCHIIFEISESNYMMTYIAFAPYTYIHGCSHATIESFLITVIYYLRARLVILAARIDNLSDEMETVKWKSDLQDIMIEHIRLLNLGNSIIGIYSTSFMIYMICTTLAICLIGFKILVNCMTGPDEHLVQFLVYLAAVYLILTLLCYLSEELMSESNKVSEAFWSCPWYRMPPKTIRNIMFCIQRSQQPLTLKIGKFANFGNNMLTVVTKSAMGYLSVLRNFLVVE